MRPLKYADYVARLRAVCACKGLPLTVIGGVDAGEYHRTTYPLYRVTVRRPLEYQYPVAFVAGVHGDEPAGPLGVLEFLEKAYPAAGDLAARGPWCPVYPLVNPWGFDHGRRVNAYGRDINRTFGVGDAPSQEAAALLGDLTGWLAGAATFRDAGGAAEAEAKVAGGRRQRPLDFLHTLHEDDSRTGFFTYFSDPAKRWLAERFLDAARAMYVPVDGWGKDAADVTIAGGLAPYTRAAHPTPPQNCPLEDRLLGQGLHHFCTETPRQADLSTRTRLAAEVMRLSWSVL